MAVVKAFFYGSMPFILAEVGTGTSSMLTGHLSLPPLIGAGTAIDMTILLAGLVTAIVRALNPGKGFVE